MSKIETLKLKDIRIENIRNNLINMLEDETRKLNNFDIFEPMQADIIKNLSIAYNNLFGQLNKKVMIDVNEVLKIRGDK